MPPKPTFDQARQFGLFLIKAVLNARADELASICDYRWWREGPLRGPRPIAQIDSLIEIRPNGRNHSRLLR